MTPQEATRYVESREVFGMRFGLRRMVAVLAELADPHLRAPAIHVVGTNGKSSTTRLAAAALHAQGLRVGAYVSPHVDGWHERIMIDGMAVDPAHFADAIGQVAACADRVLTASDDVFTQFEVLTAAAFVVFADAEVDAMVVEAGLGGRFDATNVFGGRATVALTNVGLEHTAILGDTELAIAREKLAVACEGWDRLVIGPLSPTAEGPVRQVCAERGLRAWFVGRDVLVVPDGDGGVSVRTPHARYERMRPGSGGGFQIDNLATAIAAAERFLDRPLAGEPLRRELVRVTVPGRLERIGAAPLLVLDGAHNPAGIDALVAALPAVASSGPLVAVVSIFADKDIAAMCAGLGTLVRRAIVTRSTGARAADPAEIAAALEAVGVATEVVTPPEAALARAAEVAGREGTVVVCGSLALLADIRNIALQGWSDRPGMLARGNAPEIVKKPER